MTPPRHEEGAALLAVLMLVAVLGGMTALALDRIGLATRGAANGAAAEQARGLALGAEAIALAQAARLADPRVAQAVAAGAGPRAITVPVPGGTIAARLGDGANCFNLNSVASGMQAGQLAARPMGIAQFSALMQALGVPMRQADAIAAATADWIDADTVPLPLGAEDPAYAALPTPYRTANRLMADASELRAVAGVTPALYAVLRPFVCALPTTDLSPINVNGLVPAQAPLVAMLLPGALRVEQATTVLAARPPGGWRDVAEFWRGPALGGVTPLGEVQAQPRVRIAYARAVLDIRVGSAELRETVLIDIAAGRPRIVARAWGEAA